MSVQQGERCFTCSRTEERVGFCLFERIEAAAKNFPALQYPQSFIPAFAKPFVITAYSGVLEKCSRVIISWFMARATGSLQAGTGFPFKSTVQDPQIPSAQPSFTLKRFCFLKTSISFSSGSFGLP